MPRSLARTAAAVLVLSALALPLTAQPAPRRPAPSLSLFAQLWQRIVEPVVALFSAPETDGRGGWDPDGLDGDGRRGFEPNS
jgi:hypothetical protein